MIIYGAGQTVSGVVGVHELGYAPSVEDGAVNGIPVKYAKIQRDYICNGGAKDARILAQKLQGGGALVIGNENMGTGWTCVAASGDKAGKVTAEFRRMLTPFDMLPGGWGMVLDSSAKTATLTFNWTPKWRWTASGASGDFCFTQKIVDAETTGNFTGDDLYPVGVYSVGLYLGGVSIWSFNPMWKYDGVGHGSYDSPAWTKSAYLVNDIMSVDSGLTEKPVIMYWDNANQTWRNKLRYTFGYYQEIFKEKILEELSKTYVMDSRIGDDGISIGIRNFEYDFTTWTYFSGEWPVLRAWVKLSRSMIGNYARAAADKQDAAENGLRWRWDASIGTGGGWELVYFGWRHFAITAAGAVVTADNKLGGSAV